MGANNMAAMREALETLLNLAYEVQDANSEHGPKTSVPAQFIIDTAKSALAAPPRNCDVGSAQKQFKRYRKFCMGSPFCSKCEIGVHAGSGCFLAWAQMPYRKGSDYGQE